MRLEHVRIIHNISQNFEEFKIKVANQQIEDGKNTQYIKAQQKRLRKQLRNLELVNKQH